MANAYQNAGATQEPSSSAPLYASRIFTGWFTNRSPLNDGVTTHDAEKAGYGRQDSILDGQNMEISPRLTLVRRAGITAWGGGFPYQRINRYYSFNTFTLTTEVIRVMVDDATSVYDAFDGSQKNLIFTKSPGASSTYFLGVGNTLYFTNGVDNMQATFDPTTGTWGAVSVWGVTAPVNAPLVFQQARPNTTYPAWQANTVYSAPVSETNIAIYVLDSNGNMQGAYAQTGTTGNNQPVWGYPGAPQGLTVVDGNITWHYAGPQAWAANTAISVKQAVNVSVVGVPTTFVCIAAGDTGANFPLNWPNAPGAQVQDGGVTWVNAGGTLTWLVNIGPLAPVTAHAAVLDPAGYIEIVVQAGMSGPLPGPTFATATGAQTIDGRVIWRNDGPFAPQGTAAVLYGYEYMKSASADLSNMSPKSQPVVVVLGNEIVVQGDGSGQAGVDKVVIFATAPGGSTFFQLATIDNPGAGQTWTYIDTAANDSSRLDITWQAQMAGEGTPLPVGATCMAYHLGRIFAAVGNVVWVSEGPDAIVGGSSGNAGFATSFTCQSKVTRLWATSLGMVVFTVRDAYLIQGNGVDTSQPGGTGLYIKVWIENLPLLHYDAMTVFGTTAFLFTGKNMVISLDPGAGIVEVSQAIGDVMETVDPATAYLTYHSHNSRDTALYLGNGQDTWYRLNPSIAPEAGFAWSLPAYPVMGMSALQSVEVTPGVYQLLLGPKTNGGKIFYRDTTTRLDDGAAFPAYSDFGVITLAQPGQLAGIGWMNLEAVNSQNEPKLSMLMGEIFVSPQAPLEKVKRTRHDPVNLPPSFTLNSTRYTFLRGGSPIWCRHLIFRVDFGTAGTPDELLSFTVFGSVYQEYAA